MLSKIAVYRPNGFIFFRQSSFHTTILGVYFGTYINFTHHKICRV